MGAYLDFMNFAFLCRSKPASRNLRVAVIGAGPAGLAATGYLVCRGFEVDVFDKQPLPGGMMVFAIPPWRIPKQRVLEGVKRLEEVFGVRFYTRTKVFAGEVRHEEGDMLVEKSVPLEQVVNDYHAVLISTGTWESKIPRLPGVGSEGVVSALDYLYRVRVFELGFTASPPPRPRRAVVIGGGYSAIDAAEQASRMGADATIVYRRTVREAPAGVYEVERVKREGVDFVELASPVEVVAENGRAKGVRFQRMRLGPPDESGRPQPVPVEGADFVLEADLVIFATGEAPTPPVSRSEDVLRKLGLSLKKDGSISVNRIYQTSNPKVFAAGDVVTGPSRVGPAVRSGLYAGRFVENWLETQLVKAPLTAR
ncbi:FAD-dependent oxidoreductase [Thermogladius sp.]|uniref:FAD-dependent oxidoreductase n=1 Tax=Thermogladius sp. TaxID=2023064 RepID=UPI003D123195